MNVAILQSVAAGLVDLSSDLARIPGLLLLWGLLAGAAYLATTRLAAARAQLHFQWDLLRRCPPLRDEEFARSHAGNSAAVAIAVRHALARHFCLAVEQVHPQMTLADLDRIGLQGGMTDDDFLEQMPHVSPKIALRVRETIAEATGMLPEEITPQTRLMDLD